MRSVHLREAEEFNQGELPESYPITILHSTNNTKFNILESAVLEVDSNDPSGRHVLTVT